MLSYFRLFRDNGGTHLSGNKICHSPVICSPGHIWHQLVGDLWPTVNMRAKSPLWEQGPSSMQSHKVVLDPQIPLDGRSGHIACPSEYLHASQKWAYFTVKAKIKSPVSQLALCNLEWSVSCFRATISWSLKQGWHICFEDWLREMLGTVLGTWSEFSFMRVRQQVSEWDSKSLFFHALVCFPNIFNNWGQIQEPEAQTSSCTWQLLIP